jgi:GTPase
MRYRERAVLVVVDFLKDKGWTKSDLVDELKSLVNSSGARSEASIVARRKKPDPVYFIGKGKAEEVAHLVDEKGADVVVFNEDLSCVQERNLERTTGVKVIDRTQLILDVFAQRAKSTEGKIQVELAQLEYLLPRLSGRGEMLSRLGAGIGTRGPGEQKLEIDRRRIKERISKLKKDLKKIEERRQLTREKRRKSLLPTVALVGYTNSGKSTLINAITGASQSAQNKLFSTLDPKLKRLKLPNNQSILIADTVGFLQNLPHHLIEAFKATLEEVVEADLLLHVLDASHPKVLDLKEAVYEVLGELRAMDKPIITALNKIDKIDDQSIIDNLSKRLDNCICVSALYKKNLDQLIDFIARRFSNLMTAVKILIPHDKMNLVDALHTRGKITKKEYRPAGVYIEAELPVLLAKTLKSSLSEKK